MIDMPKQPTISETTVQTVIKVFFLNFQHRNPQQHTNMAMALRSFCEFFEGTGKQVKEIDEIYKDPIAYTIKKQREHFTPKVKKRIKIKKTLSNLDWIFFRDTCLNSKLNHTYSQNITKARAKRKSIMLSEIIDILGFIKGDLYKILVEVAVKTNTSMDIDLTALAPKTTERVGITDANT